MFGRRRRTGYVVPLVLLAVLILPGAVAAGSTRTHAVDPAVAPSTGRPDRSATPEAGRGTDRPVPSASGAVAPSTGGGTPRWVNATPALEALHNASGLPAAPPALEGAVMAQSPGATLGARFVNVLFGGFEPSTGTYSDQTWLYLGNLTDGGAGYWENATHPLNAPPAVANASFDFDPRIPGFVLFGGITEDGTLSGQTWILNATTWRWINDTGVGCTLGCPRAREYASEAYASDFADLYTFVFGGCANPTCTQAFNDTWYLEEISGAFEWYLQTTPVAPSPRFDAAMAFAGSVVGGLVLFGGCAPSGGCTLQDTWYMIAGSWTNATSSLLANASATPPGVFGPSITFDASSDLVVLAGGGPNASTPVPSTWQFACLGGPCRWSNSTSEAGGLARVGAAMPGNTSLGVPMAFGGSEGPMGAPSNDTWVLQTVPTFTVNLTNLTPEVNQSIGVLASAVGPPPGDYVAAAIWSFDGPFGAHNLSVDPVTWKFPSGGTWYVNGTAIDPNDVSRTVRFVLNVGTPGVQAEAQDPVTDVGVADNFTAEPLPPLTAPLYYRWTFGDGGLAGTANASHAYTATGVYTVQVELSDGLGNTAQRSFSVTVDSKPLANASASVAESVVDRPVGFNGSAIDGTAPYSFHWSFADGTAGNDTANATHAFAEPGNYSVELESIDAVGSVADARVQVEIRPALTVIATVNASEVSVGSPVQFSATVDGGVGFDAISWEFGDSSTGALPTLVHTYWVSGNYSATVWVNDSGGDTATGTVEVHVAGSPSLPTSTAPPGTGPVPVEELAIVLAVALAIVLIVLLLRPSRPTDPRPEDRDPPE